MKQINTKYLKSLNPCQDRLDNWIEHYNEKNISLLKFLDLKKITRQDKVWVYFRSINKELLPLVAADFAEGVLHFYEDKYPKDLRPRKAIEAARSKSIVAKATNAAYTAADAAAYAAACAAAVNAAYAAAYAAYAAAYATNTIHAANAAYAAVNAANAAANAAYAAASTAYSCFIAASYAFYAERTIKNNVEKSQIKIMKKYLRR